jgi:hypothetical protein
MRYLLDINLIIALMDPDHVFHQRAHDWWGEAGKPWASCPLTENGFVRITSSAAYSSGETATVLEMASMLSAFTKSSNHEFWADSFSITDTSHFNHALILAPKHLTDLYLLKMASKNSGCLATFDRNIPATAALDVGKENLKIL